MKGPGAGGSAPEEPGKVCLEVKRGGGHDAEVLQGMLQSRIINFENSVVSRD